MPNQLILHDVSAYKSMFKFLVYQYKNLSSPDVLGNLLGDMELTEFSTVHYIKHGP